MYIRMSPLPHPFWSPQETQNKVDLHATRKKSYPSLNLPSPKRHGYVCISSNPPKIGAIRTPTSHRRDGRIHQQMMSCPISLPFVRYGIYFPPSSMENPRYTVKIKSNMSIPIIFSQTPHTKTPFSRTLAPHSALQRPFVMNRRTFPIHIVHVVASRSQTINIHKKPHQIQDVASAIRVCNSIPK